MELSVEELQHILLDLTALEAKVETEYTKKLLTRERQARRRARRAHPTRPFPLTSTRNKGDGGEARREDARGARGR